MDAKVIRREKQVLTVQVKVRLNDSMIKNEEAIQVALNEAGCLATHEALKGFDTDGSSIIVDGKKFTVQRRHPETYQSPHGPVKVDRYVYQSSQGGKTHCPMEDSARIVLKSTPRFARMVSFKYGSMGSTSVVRDLEETLGRKVARSFVQNIGEAVGTFIGAKETSWEYAPPKLDKPARTVTIGLDGTMMLLCEDGWREAMVGTMGFYDRKGDRQHTIYVAATPEYGKNNFLTRFSREIEQIKARFPNATYLGLADGAKENWSFLAERTDEQLLDFYHASEYLGTAASAIFRKAAEREEWLDQACHRLKHNKRGAAQLLVEMTGFLNENKISEAKQLKLKSCVTYFKNNKKRMLYAVHAEENRPIGSGVTESAAKTIVKQRLCNSGMRWKEEGAATVLNIRTRILTDGRWDEVWKKVDQYGFQKIAA